MGRLIYHGRLRRDGGALIVGGFFQGPSQDARIVGGLLLMGSAIKWIKPIQRLIRREATFSLAAALLLGLIGTGWMFKELGPDYSLYTVAPLSKFGPLDWIQSVVGACIYVLAVFIYRRLDREPSAPEPELQKAMEQLTQQVANLTAEVANLRAQTGSSEAPPPGSAQNSPPPS